MGMGSAWLSKGHTLSAFYLLACAVLLMLVTFATEGIIFPRNCTIVCPSVGGGSVGFLSNIGRLRPPLGEVLLETLEGKSSTVELQVVSNSTADETSETSETEISETSQGDASISHVNDDVLSESENRTSKSPESEISKDSKGALSPNGNSSTSDSTSKADTIGQAELRTGGIEIQVNVDPEPTALEVPEFRDDVENVTELSAVASPPPNHISSIWYYSTVYKHPEAKLRLLTEEDGASRIRSNITPPEREITIVTQTSADRIHAVEETCMTWTGAMCVAVHVRLKSDIAPVYKLLKEVQARVEEHRRSCRLDLQLVTEDGYKTDEEAIQALYPVNALRNVAMGMATTKLVFLLDADFKPSPRLHESLTEDEGIYGDLLKKATEDKQLFVVAAFEAIDLKGDYTHVSVPESMDELRERWEKGNIWCFHCHQSPTGHMPTKFETFLDPATTAPYSISYRDGFEPYVIGAAAELPLYDARFRGYGENKVSHLYSCAAAGMEFQVFPNAFVFELPHPPSQARESYVGKNKDPDQRYRILGLYKQFRDEVGREQMKKDPHKYRQFLEGLKH